MNENEPDENVTGTSLIRRAVKLRVKRTSYGVVAREVGVANETLLAFAENRRDLPVDKLRALAKELWQQIEFDPETDRLRPANREPPQPLAPCRPGPVIVDPDHIARGSYGENAPRLVDAKPQPKPRKGRPGWLGGWI